MLRHLEKKQYKDAMEIADSIDWTTAELIPVWRFYIPAEQLTESEMGVVAVNDDIPTDIYINAIDGKIEQMN